MTTTEIDILLKEIQAATDRGDWEEAHKLTTRLPVPPRVALSGKESFGADWMRQEGYNLSLADAQYGKGWLDA